MESPMFKFLHTADIHLDSPLKGLERYEGAPADKIRQATRGALIKLVDLALDERVAFVLIAGDLYDGTWKDYNTGLFFIRQMSRLWDAGIPVYLIAGNHDAENKMTLKLRLPKDKATLFGSENPQTEILKDLGVAIHGQSYAKANENRRLAEGYPQAKQGYFNIGMLHTCAGRQGHADYAPCSLEELRSKGYDYWALGHVHKREPFPNDPTIVFPGNLQGRFFSESEIGPKGCMLVTVQDDSSVRSEFQTRDVFRWELCKVNASGAENGDMVMERISEELQKKLGASEGRPLAVRVEIHGICPFHNQLHANSRKWVNEARASANEIGADHLWIEKLKFETKLPSVKDAKSMDGPMAELLALLDQLHAQDDQLTKLYEDLADLDKKLPPEMKEGPNALNLTDPAWLRDVLGHVGPMLIERLRSREE
jgi:DNA repair exonuclease SbcCD nuclease subunit